MATSDGAKAERDTGTALEPAPVTTLALAAGHALRVDGAGTEVCLTRADGAPALTIRMTEAGPVLQLHGSLSIQATGIIGIEGERIGIRGRSGVSIESGGDAAIVAAGDLKTEADAQLIRARLGDVEVKANDDVRLRAERIRLNC